LSTTTEANQLVRIPVGYDLFQGEVIQAACADAGIKVRLVRNEHPVTGSLIALQPSYLLVRAEDVQRVNVIVERTYPLETGSAEE
jgi:hypothetical protein